MQDNAIENAVEHPVFVHEGVEVRDHMETENSMANNTARGQEYAISDIPLSGTGVVGNLGVGGGGTGTYGFREGGGRRRAALKGGGSRKSEDMVDNALQWLARNQQPDGSWSVRRWGGSKGDDADVGLTGAALLTFLGAGQTEKTGKYKEVVGKAVDYLISQQAADGAIGFNTGSPEAGSGYNHAMAGLALAEAYGMACQQRTGAAAQKAVDYSVNNFQRPYSGWGYAPRQEPNTSVTGWFMMQLKSAKVAGLRVDGKGFQGAIAWLDKVQNLADAPTNPGKARFRPGMEPTPAMTAIAMVGRQFLGWKQSDPLLIGAADYLAQNLPRWDSPDLQYWYHGTLGMFQMGGDWWKQWNAALRDMLVEKQLRSDDPGMAGSWTVDDEWGRAGGRAFATALGALCLEVYYRYLPIYNGAKTPAPAPAVPAAAAPTQFVKLTEAEARELDARALSLAGLAKAAAPAAAVEAPPEAKVEPAPIAQADIARMPEDDLPPPPVNPFVMTAKDRFSTFAMDVDTASYSMARSYIRPGALPPARTVRMEEFVNAFDYNYPRRGMGVFNIFAEGMPAPFGQGLHLLKIGVQARVIGREGRKPAHLVFVVDTSGSMDKPERLGLAREALGMLLGELAPADTISVVIYGTRADIVMESVPASRRDEIAAALDSLRCGGSTNVAEGVRLGYALARRAFRAGGINRVVLCSDGVANVGAERAEEMLATVKESRECGITFTAAGFGTGAYNDELMEKLADSGDGNYVFIDSREEARRVFVEQMTATLQTVAKDAKIQVEFDPVRVRRYRLIGYENRDIADKDFRNDAVDAGEVGSGQSVTALYEVELAEPAGAARSGGIGTVYVRYRNVETNKVEEISSTIAREDVSDRRPEAAEAPRMYLAAGVAEFAEILRRSEHAAGAKLAPVEHMLTGVSAALPLDGRIRELVQLVGAAKSLAGER